MSSHSYTASCKHSHSYTAFYKARHTLIQLLTRLDDQITRRYTFHVTRNPHSPNDVNLLSKRNVHASSFCVSSASFSEVLLQLHRMSRTLLLSLKGFAADVGFFAPR